MKSVKFRIAGCIGLLIWADSLLLIDFFIDSQLFSKFLPIGFGLGVCIATPCSFIMSRNYDADNNLDREFITIEIFLLIILVVLLIFRR